MEILASVLHIDHDLGFAALLRREIATWGHVKYVGLSRSGEGGLALWHRQRPDIVIIEADLPDGDGFSFANTMHFEDPTQKIIMLTESSTDLLVYRFLKSPILGFVWKTEQALQQLREAFEAVLQNRRYWPPEFARARDRLWSQPDAFFKIFSKRELDLIPHLGKGETDAKIATLTGLAEATVRGHRQRIMSRLGLHRTSDLMLWSVRVGFVRPLSPAPPCMMLPGK